MTLTEFLLARIAEEGEARLLELCGGDSSAAPAMRDSMAWRCAELGLSIRRMMASMPRPIPQRVAEKYADHPDYREEWKP